MNEITLQSNNGPLGPVSKYFAQLPAMPDSLAAGIQASYGVIGYKGKVWSLRYRGENNPIMRSDGSGDPVSAIDLVVIKAPPHLSKIYYETGYTEGSNAPPDCFSNNGVVPDPSSRKLQNPVCATCKWNVWGSRVSQQQGRVSQGKACSDSKRTAVVPLGNIKNEQMGGPMLLRVPPASLQDLAGYGMHLSKFGYPYFAVGTRISFDLKEAYPKFLFQATRVLTDEEAQLVMETQNDPIVDRILAETGAPQELGEVAETPRTSTFEQQPQGAQSPPLVVNSPQMEQPAQQPVTTMQATPVQQPAPTTAAPPIQPAQPQQPTPEQIAAYLAEQERLKMQAATAAIQPPPAQPVQQQQTQPQGDAPQMPAGWGDATAIESELDAKLQGLLAG